MNWDQIEGNWTRVKGKFLEQWGRLTDDDIDVIRGKRTQLSGLLQQRYGIAKERAEEEIEQFVRGLEEEDGGLSDDPEQLRRGM